MKEYLLKVRELVFISHGVKLEDSELESINQTVLIGNQTNLFQIEMGLCASQKNQCVDQLHFALDKYHHAGMGTEEIKTIASNVLINKAPTPDITDTVRLLLI